MALLNPDYRGADEIIVPQFPQFGWTGTVIEEQKSIAALAADSPLLVRQYLDSPDDPTLRKSWDDFQASKGRFAGSNDLTLLDEFVFKKSFAWLPQIIGSCVVSNTFRAWVLRLMYQIVIRGEAMEYLGLAEFGPKSLSFYAPVSYGLMRRRGGLRGGDGGFCAPMGESLSKDGVLMCTTPKLLEILKTLNADGPNDFPEPQNAGVYRAFGNGSYLDTLKQFMDYPLRECPEIKTEEQAWSLAQAGKPSFWCSNIAIKKVGQHPDGFAIHADDPTNSWAHNMSKHGCMIASNGDEFYRWSNESWGVTHIYNIARPTVRKWIQQGRISAMAIGQIDGPKSSPIIA
jgi:hypothetical protein